MSPTFMNSNNPNAKTDPVQVAMQRAAQLKDQWRSSQLTDQLKQHMEAKTDQ